MNNVSDLSKCPKSGLFYNGHSDQKEGILIDDEPWMVKYPRPLNCSQGKQSSGFISSSVSEYIGSHIYALFGIPAQITKLGYRDGEIVCACKDFTYPSGRLFEFSKIKNSLSDETPGFYSAPSDGECMYLSDLLQGPTSEDVIKRSMLFEP